MSSNKVADHWCLSERQGHHLQSNGAIDLELDGGTASLHPEIGVTKGNTRVKWSPQMADRWCLSERQGHHLQSNGAIDLELHGGTTSLHPEIGLTKVNTRAKWSHQMKLFLVRLLKDYDVPGFRTHNAWSKEAWTNIVSRLNQRFDQSFTLNQVKQKEQDLKRDYRNVKELLDQSGFGWDKDRKMVDAPDNVWASFAARKNNKDVLQWKERSFPLYEELAPLYEGRYAEGRTRRGLDHYTRKRKHAPVPSSQSTQVTDLYQSPSPTMPAAGESDMQFTLDEKLDEFNLDSPPHLSTPIQHVQAPPRSTQMEKHDTRRGKKQKRGANDDFHEKYLKLKKEEIDRFAAIEEKKLEDPCTINKCITAVEGLEGLQLGDMLMASDIFKCKENREVFLSYSTNELRLAWLKREIARAQTTHQN
ncbi:hypothetical protein VPH35_128426 [Triticum aestivum]|uniref:WAC domain-containing protein n=1 Tax=Triticum aestivum TaxID=4565 RepID=A0A3B6SB03_WHEAT|nr:L10-interacting MYB domain-containing protein-like isoform X1 [Triticum aestivum]